MPRILATATTLKPCVYFVQHEGRVKIGCTRNLRQRFLQIRGNTYGSFKPELLGFVIVRPPTEPIVVERRVHEVWQRLRLRGEWFKLTHELREWIRLVDGWRV